MTSQLMDSYPVHHQKWVIPNMPGGKFPRYPTYPTAQSPQSCSQTAFLRAADAQDARQRGVWPAKYRTNFRFSSKYPIRRVDVTMENTAKVPRDLAKNGRSLWRNVIDAGYTLDPAEYVLLHQLCRTTDVLDRISAELATMGVVVSGSEKQPVVNKLLHEMREQNKVFDLLQRALALPVAGESYGSRRSGDQKRTAKAPRRRKINENKVSHLIRREGA